MGLIDTSVIVGPGPLDTSGASISVVTIAELQFGVERAKEPRLRELRQTRLHAVREAFDPLPVDAAVCLRWGHLAAHMAAHGRRPRSRAMDLLIAATAQEHGLTLLTRDEDLLWLADVLDVRRV